MCGIAGFVTGKESTLTPAAGERVLRSMTGRLRHRGPDDAGIYVSAVHPAFLAHRRLSIIDVAGGHQPFANEDGSAWIVYNGEVFNHSSIRTGLERAGHRYVSRSDTETVLHAYEEYGEACLEHFRGMFAFAIWDEKARTLFCARDRLGIKPFYYFWDRSLLAFASEIKALLAHPAISAEPEETLLGEYLGFGYLSGERTLFRGIRKLMPGHFLRLDCSAGQPRMSVERYWDVPQTAGGSARMPEEEWISETRRRLEESVRMRLMSDVPLGVFLSGGVDSSAITALVQQNTDRPVKTFAVAYPEAEFSELAYAAEVAGYLGTDHYTTVIGREEFFDALPEVIWHEDEPAAWPSSVALYYLSKLASKHVKMVLTGEGSDELFGGYERYRWHLINQKCAGVYSLLPGGLRDWARRAVGASKLLSVDVRRKIGHAFLARQASLESLYLDNFYCAFPEAEQAALLRVPGTESMYGAFRDHWDARRGDPLLARMLYADQKTYLSELLMKQDQMSMAWSVESRVPFLDHPLVEFAAQTPGRLKIRGGVQKYVLKKAVADLLPQEIVHRPKMGFPTPLRQWLRESKAEGQFHSLQDRRSWMASYIDLDEVNRLVDRHRSGEIDATDRIWRLLNLQIWGEMFFAGRRARVATVA